MSDEEEMGLADAMMMRGAHLRKLRELADADAREKEKWAKDAEGESNSSDGKRDNIVQLDNGKCLLRYESYLAHQRYYDDLKHYDCDYIDFSGLVIQQDKALGKGGICWDAAFILAEHIIHCGINIYPDDAIVELGSGTGLCGLLLASKIQCRVDITDLPSLIPLMQRNIDLNFGHVNDVSMCNRDIMFAHSKLAHLGTCEARILEWGPQPANQKKYRVILGADVVASLYDPEALATTIHQLSAPETIVCISYKCRLDEPHRRFERRLQQLYQHVQTGITPLSRNKNPGVFILQASGKNLDTSTTADADSQLHWKS